MINLQKFTNFLYMTMFHTNTTEDVSFADTVLYAYACCTKTVNAPSCSTCSLLIPLYPRSIKVRTLPIHHGVTLLGKAMNSLIFWYMVLALCRRLEKVMFLFRMLLCKYCSITYYHTAMSYGYNNHTMMKTFNNVENNVVKKVI